MPQSPSRPLSRRTLAALAGVLALAITIGGCAGPSANAPTTGALGTAPGAAGTGTVRIALILPLSSDSATAALARGMKQAAELAIFDINRPELQLIVKDDKGSVVGAMAAAEDAVKGGAEIILGPLLARNTKAIAPIARRAGIPVISLSNDPSAAGNGVYLLGFTPDDEARRIVAYAASQGRRRVAAWVPADAYGALVEAGLAAAAATSGATVVAIERYPAGPGMLSASARRLTAALATAAGRGQAAEALLLAGPGDMAAALARSAREAGVDPARIRFLHTGGFEMTTAARERALAGGWLAAPEPRGWQAFAGRFRSVHRTSPPRLASLAYDAMTLAGALVGGTKGERFSATRLTRATGFDGRDGHIRLLSNGRIERQLAILELRSDGPAIIEGPRADPAIANAIRRVPTVTAAN